MRRGGLVSARVLEQLDGNRGGDELGELEQIGELEQRVELEQLGELEQRVELEQRGELARCVSRCVNGCRFASVQQQSSSALLGRRMRRSSINLRHDTVTRRTCACGIEYNGADWAALPSRRGDARRRRGAPRAAQLQTMRLLDVSPEPGASLLREVIGSCRAIAAIIQRLADLSEKSSVHPNRFDGLRGLVWAFQQGYRGDRSVPAPVAGE